MITSFQPFSREFIFKRMGIEKKSMREQKKACGKRRRLTDEDIDGEYRPPSSTKRGKESINVLSHLSIASSHRKIVDVRDCVERCLDFPSRCFKREEYLFSKRVSIKGESCHFWEAMLDVPESTFTVHLSQVDFCFDGDRAIKCPKGYWVYKCKKDAEDAVLLKAIAILRPDFFNHWLDGRDVVQVWKAGYGGTRYFKSSNLPVDGWFVLFTNNKSVYGVCSSEVEFVSNGIAKKSSNDKVYHVI